MEKTTRIPKLRKADFPDGSTRWHFGLALGDYFLDYERIEAHRQACGFPSGYRYGLYRSGRKEKECATRVGIYKTRADAFKALLAARAEGKEYRNGKKQNERRIE